MSCAYVWFVKTFIAAHRTTMFGLIFEPCDLGTMHGCRFVCLG